MSANKREVKEGTQFQGTEEKIAYTITTTPWASSPALVGSVAYDITDGGRTDVSLSVLSGAGSAVGDIITTPLVQNLIYGHKYRIEVKFTAGGLTFEPYFIIDAEY